MSYSMIIADDEEFSRDGVRRLIESAFPQINIVNVCKDGAEAISNLSKNPVDIVIADIHMPHATGLDIAEYIKEHQLNTIIIIMTGYNLFEYAKKAIDYKVCCFLTKPFLSEDLIASVNDAIEKINNKIQLSIDMANRQLQSHALKRNILSQLFSGKPPEEITSFPEMTFFCERTISDVNIYQIVFHSNGEDIKSLQSQAINLGEFYSSEYSSYLIFADNTELVFLLLTDKENINIINTFTNEFVNGFKLFHLVDLTYTIQHFSNVKAWLANCEFLIICRDYAQYIHKENYNFASDNLTNSLDKMSRDELLTFYSVFLNYTEQVFMLHLNDVVDNDMTVKQILSQIAFIHQEIIQKSKKSDDIISKVKTCVDKNYANYDISLFNLAKQFHMNETYLSKLFKDKTNERFTDYLVRVRVENAKKLLKSGNNKIQDVSRAVGYSQVKYFRTVFKKQTGITASEYIKNCVINDYVINGDKK